jgi:hypothetical protein
VIAAVLRDRALDDVQRLRDRTAILVGRGFPVLVPDIGGGHLEVSIHASTRQTHDGLMCVKLPAACGRPLVIIEPRLADQVRRMALKVLNELQRAVWGRGDDMRRKGRAL